MINMSMVNLKLDGISICFHFDWNRSLAENAQSKEFHEVLVASEDAGHIDK